MTELVNDTHIRVLVCDSVAQELLDGLKNEGYNVDYKPEITKSELVENISDYQIIVVRSRTKVDSDVMDAAKNLKIIARAGIGIDNIDSESANSKGVKIITAAGSSTESVVELNLVLAIDLARRISALNRKIREGEYKKQKGKELSGSTCGVIGFGRIGYETARVLSSLGANIVAYDIVHNDELIKTIGGRYVELDDLLSSSDFIFTCVTLNGSSKSLMAKEQFSRVKEGAYIINTSRAEAMDGVALLEALKAGRIGGYAADVMWNEPPKEEWEKELINMENVIVTPHIGAQTREAQKRVALATVENVAKAVRGEL
ncbi:hypothetical protein IX51_09815 [uncultured archaeon]|nr:hypothetical protein IX51_09815 [uncultured archaeon]